MEIKIRNMSKIYPNGNRALSDIDLTIPNGMFGLLGPNGAGKTTLMRILVTLLKPTTGEVTVNGLDLQKNRKEIRAMLGYLPQDFTVFTKLKTWEFLDYIASLGGLKNSKRRADAVDQMLESVGLFDVRDRMAQKLSGGMKRRLGIAQALIGDPKIVVVDEPTTGLDPEERLRFRNLLSEMSRKEIIIILSTHIVGDISSSCHNMALIYKGRADFIGSPQEIIERAQGHVWEITADDSQLQRIKERFPVISTIPAEFGYEVRVIADNPQDFRCEQAEPNLEDAYVYHIEKLDPEFVHD
ncbi:ATP-binding cassette domain-containing protein [candidate division KSB1 bacterium]|nr:ATP-binding cassette domain-containing protein [candidate division KSB1 bacterium]